MTVYSSKIVSSIVTLIFGGDFNACYATVKLGETKLNPAFKSKTGV